MKVSYCVWFPAKDMETCSLSRIKSQLELFRMILLVCDFPIVLMSELMGRGDASFTAWSQVRNRMKYLTGEINK